MNWEDSQVRFITKVVRSHDRALFARRSRLGHIDIMRRATRAEAFAVGSDVVVNFKESPQLVFSLTDNWTANGKPVNWGSEVVLQRLQKIDAWNRADFLRELEEQDRKAKESADRDRKNRDEAFLYDMHGQFKETFKDVRVANMDKTEKRRRRFEQRLNK